MEEPNDACISRDQNQLGSQSFSMAKKTTNMLAVTVITVLIMLVLEPQPAECRFSIALNPCTLLLCISRCEEITNGKFKGAACKTTPAGQFCLCS
ncbi:hypothetical protein CR513_44359, partial [Mucuna pruriens]